jgi:hypothetical protein
MSTKTCDTAYDPGQLPVTFDEFVPNAKIQIPGCTGGVATVELSKLDGTDPFGEDSAATYFDFNATTKALTNVDSAFIFQLTNFVVNNATGRISLPGLPTYADNAAALTGGLVANNVYKTAAGELRIVV